MKIRTALFLTMILLLGVTARSASAHALDSGLMLEKVRVGPYRLTVWATFTIQESVLVHTSSYIVPEGGEAPVMAARVRYHFVEIGGDAPEIQQLARTASPLNGFLHETTVELPHPGRYRVTISIADSLGWQGERVYYLDALPAPWWLKGVVTGLLVVGVAGMVWLLKEGFHIWRKEHG